MRMTGDQGWRRIWPYHAKRNPKNRAQAKSKIIEGVAMKTEIRLLAVTVGLLTAQISLAQAPAGSTGQCKDGTYTTAASKQGACHGHQGVKDWYAAAPTAPAAPVTPAAAPAAPKTAAAPTAPGPIPHNATGLCNDGVYAMSTSKSAACRGHQGVKEWYAAAPAAAAPAAAPAAAQSAPAAPKAAPASAPAAPPAPAAAPAKSGATTSSKTASMPQAAGGGPGLVWVNTSSNVYHCYGSSYYGKTKEGSYMSEADAKAKGAHADHGKACTN
jgi:Protein of unknown function (DUF3761)